MKLIRLAGRDGTWTTRCASLTAYWSRCMAALGLLTPCARTPHHEVSTLSARHCPGCAHPNTQAVATLTLGPVGPVVRAAPHDRLTELKHGLGALMLSERRKHVLLPAPFGGRTTLSSHNANRLINYAALLLQLPWPRYACRKRAAWPAPDPPHAGWAPDGSQTNTRAPRSLRRGRLSTGWALGRRATSQYR